MSLDLNIVTASDFLVFWVLRMIRCQLDGPWKKNNSVRVLAVKTIMANDRKYYFHVKNYFALALLVPIINLVVKINEHFSALKPSYWSWFELNSCLHFDLLQIELKYALFRNSNPILLSFFLTWNDFTLIFLLKIVQVQ